MVIAIFIVAIVVAFSLAVMSKGMGTSVKSGDVNIATAIAEQEMARVKNIPFPPTTVDRQSEYPPVAEAWNNANPPYNNDFQVAATSLNYDSAYASGAAIDNTMLKRITVKVKRIRDQAVLATFITYIARNGTI